MRAVLQVYPLQQAFTIMRATATSFLSLTGLAAMAVVNPVHALQPDTVLTPPAPLAGERKWLASEMGGMGDTIVSCSRGGGL